MSVKARQEIERRIARAFVREALKAGYSITVAEGSDPGDEPLKQSRSLKDVLAAMFTVDDEHLYLHDAEGVIIGWTYFVYGNDGWDVISDYTVNLEDLMTTANAISEKYQ